MRKIFDIADRLNSKLAVRRIVQLPSSTDEGEPEQVENPSDSEDLGSLPDEEREYLERLYNHPEWAGLQEMKPKGRSKSDKRTQLDSERALEIEKEIGTELFGAMDADVTRAVRDQLDAKGFEDYWPSIIGVIIDGGNPELWVFNKSIEMYSKSNTDNPMAVPISSESLSKSSKIYYIACKFATRTSLMLPPPMDEENSDTIPAPAPDTIPAPPMDTEPAPAPALPTMPSPATPAFMGEVEREALIGDYQLITEMDRDRVKQASSVYIKNKEGEVIADWTGLSSKETDLVWRVAEDILNATQN